MIRTVSIVDAEYPALLKTIHSPPKVLYVNGAFKKEDENSVAIVGSRRATLYGVEMAQNLGYELALRGVTIVSGLARGIDSAAHRGALKARGRTIAVMGSGHGHIYPPENKELYARIVSAGAVISEYEDDTAPLARNFPVRNRIISGLSLGVVVVEAARNSGALITSDFALEEGREVFAVPGKISSLTSEGTHELIKDGAKLVQRADDILEELNMRCLQPLSGPDAKTRSEKRSKKTNAYIYNSLTEDERKVYKLLDDEGLYIDDVAGRSGVAMDRVSEALLKLEIKKLIKQLPGKRFARLCV